MAIYTAQDVDLTGAIFDRKTARRRRWQRLSGQITRSERASEHYSDGARRIDELPSHYRSTLSVGPTDLAWMVVTGK